MRSEVGVSATGQEGPSCRKEEEKEEENLAFWVKTLFKLSGISYNFANAVDQPINKWKRRAYLCYHYYAIFIWLSTPTLAVISAFLFRDEPKTMANNIALGLSGVGNLRSVLILFFKRDSLESLVSRIKHDTIMPSKNIVIKIHPVGGFGWKHLNMKSLKTHKKLFLLAVNIIISVTIFALLPPFLSALNLISKSYSHIFQFWYPFDTASSPYYEMCYLFELSIVFVVFFSNTGSFMLLLYLSTSLNGGFDSLSKEINEICAAAAPAERKVRCHSVQSLSNDSSDKTYPPTPKYRKTSSYRCTVPSVVTVRPQSAGTLCFDINGRKRQTQTSECLVKTDVSESALQKVQNDSYDIVDDYVQRANENVPPPKIVTNINDENDQRLNSEEVKIQMQHDDPPQDDCNDFVKLKRNEDIAIGHLSGCIRQHQALMIFANDIIELYSSVLLYQLVISYSGIALYVFESSQNNESAYLIMRQLLNVSLIFIRLFLVSWISESISEKSAAVGEAAYASQWEERSPTFKFYVGMIMLRAQSPLTLKAGKFYNMTFATAVQTVNGSYSLLNVLKNVASKK